MAETNSAVLGNRGEVAGAEIAAERADLKARRRLYFRDFLSYPAAFLDVAGLGNCCLLPRGYWQLGITVAAAHLAARSPMSRRGAENER